MDAPLPPARRALLAALVASLPLALAAASCSTGFGVAGTSYHVGPAPGEGFGERAERAWTEALDLGDAARLELAAGHADVRVEASDGPPSVDLRAELHGRTRAEAEAALAGIALRPRRVDDTLRLTVDAPALEARDGRRTLRVGPRLALVVRVPAGVAVRVGADTGDLEVRGLAGGARLETRFGAVRADNVGGGLVVRTSSGDVEVRGLAGGDLDARSDFGRVELADLDAGRVRVEVGSGGLALARARAREVEVHARFGRVRVVDVRADVLRVETESGDLVLEDVAADEVEARSAFGNVAVSGAPARLDARSGSGNVRLEATTARGFGAWTLRSDHGTVTLVAPAELACELDARTDHGRLACDFELARAPGAAEGRVLRGRIGGGGPPVELAAGSGDVAVRRQR